MIPVSRLWLREQVHWSPLMTLEPPAEMPERVEGEAGGSTEFTLCACRCLGALRVPNGARCLCIMATTATGPRDLASAGIRALPYGDARARRSAMQARSVTFSRVMAPPGAKAQRHTPGIRLLTKTCHRDPIRSAAVNVQRPRAHSDGQGTNPGDRRLQLPRAAVARPARFGAFWRRRPPS